MKKSVIVVDDNDSVIKTAGYILSHSGIHVTGIRSGTKFLSYIKEHTADLVLLDINMPVMNGFETLEKLREWEKSKSKPSIPVIFLTADDDTDKEEKCLELGAADFIKKPFIPNVLILRVTHCIELVRLQRDLKKEVDEKSAENEQLMLHVVKSLAISIEAKDNYTNGHSERVAEYSMQIAARFGYSEEMLADIYMMGLLHDVGKIGIPDGIINKTGKLTEEEFGMIKQHPVIGYRILRNIDEKPELAGAARWHHEKYNGQGYPDGLSGKDIPEYARIIAVADSYDAMTSNRSYRKALSQQEVLAEIIKGRGTQFDPDFADIMIGMMDEDTDFLMRER